jgi:predicted nucleic acid-binding protein
MDPDELPADASCLIYLAKIDGFALAARCLSALVVAPAVWREAVEDGERLGYADAVNITEAHEAGFLARIELDESSTAFAGQLAATWRLGQGEGETLAIGSRIGRVVVDDGRAARVAHTLGIEPVSTLFLPALGAVRELDAASALTFARDLAVVMNARAEALIAVEEFIRRST